MALGGLTLAINTKRESISKWFSNKSENIDYIVLKKGVDDTDTSNLFTSLGYTKQQITQSEHIYILSERGYVEM